jgi:hypothetical protein
MTLVTSSRRGAMYCGWAARRKRVLVRPCGLGDVSGGWSGWVRWCVSVGVGVYEMSWEWAIKGGRKREREKKEEERTRAEVCIAATFNANTLNVIFAGSRSSSSAKSRSWVRKSFYDPRVSHCNGQRTNPRKDEGRRAMKKGRGRRAKGEGRRKKGYRKTHTGIPGPFFPSF